MVFVSPISLSHQPPYQGAHFGLNFLSMHIFSSLGISRDAEINVAALSEYIVRGVPLLLMKRLNPNTNDSSDKSGISSR